jgi:uncharacterized Fe-S cluster-containing MiaB family protein
LGKKEKTQKMLEHWQGENQLKVDSWKNVQSVLESYGFSYEKKTHWVCSHPVLSSLAKNPSQKELLKYCNLDVLGQFSVSVTHGKGKDSGMVLHVYLSNIVKAIEFVEFISSLDAKRKEEEENGK